MPRPGSASTARTRKLSTFEVLAGECRLADAIMPTAVPRLWIAPSTLDLLGIELQIANEKDRSFRLRNAIRSLPASLPDNPGGFTYVLIDCPPSLNLLTINALASADSVVVPLQCEFFALEGLSQLLSTVEHGAAQPQPQPVDPRRRSDDV